MLPYGLGLRLVIFNTTKYGDIYIKDTAVTLDTQGETKYSGVFNGVDPIVPPHSSDVKLDYGNSLLMLLIRPFHCVPHLVDISNTV